MLIDPQWQYISVEFRAGFIVSTGVACYTVKMLCGLKKKRTRSQSLWFEKSRGNKSGFPPLIKEQSHTLRFRLQTLGIFLFASSPNSPRKVTDWKNNGCGWLMWSASQGSLRALAHSGCDQQEERVLLSYMYVNRSILIKPATEVTGVYFSRTFFYSGQMH